MHCKYKGFFGSTGKVYRGNPACIGFGGGNGKGAGAGGDEKLYRSIDCGVTIKAFNGGADSDLTVDLLHKCGGGNIHFSNCIRKNSRNNCSDWADDRIIEGSGSCRSKS